ncbi:hypothetical protein [Botrimarina mediterranea]|uniref:Bacterial type II/III secretion system short domain protein n=1 Tax=Botrimarina mediterranea TaxID=2528022 RepID=A0A518K3T5_9BACT|nr:hypothetical protein [Botrimarina mediterranea]QDV72435.1 hypothetical protein Spa11_06110 [Botrimarina mediterranea]QDV76981.1 hypothetical protein K2D_05660 [Planctomycetes bacterium K2D]
MSQRVWLASVLAVALGVVGVLVERSRSQEEAPERAVSQPQAEASGEFGGGFGRASGGGGEFGGRGGDFGRGGGGGFAGRGGGFGGRGEFGASTTAEAPEAKPLPAPAVPRIWVSEDPERTEELYEILKSPLPSAGLEFPDGTALEEVIAYLSDEYRVPILLDTVALDELGIGSDEPVAISVRNIQLGQAMRRMLEPLELTYVVDDGVLLVTSEEEALTKLHVAIYDVRDLLLEGDFGSLQDLITSTIASDTWVENGAGEAEIVAYPQRGVLVISQTMAVHEEIARLLAAMRRMSFDPDARPLTKRTNNHVQAAAIRDSIEAAGREYDAQLSPGGGGAFSILDSSSVTDVSAAVE